MVRQDGQRTQGANSPPRWRRQSSARIASALVWPSARSRPGHARLAAYLLGFPPLFHNFYLAHRRRGLRTSAVYRLPACTRASFSGSGLAGAVEANGRGACHAALPTSAFFRKGSFRAPRQIGRDGSQYRRAGAAKPGWCCEVCALARISHVFRLDHDNLACKNAPMRAIAARASGRMRANICQTWNMRGQVSSSTSQPVARRRSAIRSASSRNASSLPT